MSPAAFESGLDELGLELTPQQVEQLARYLRQLRKWNDTYNLVAAGDLQSLVTRHLFDSLSIHAHTGPGTLLDVGSGAGFPGLPLAICRPELQVTLLDSAGKKARFMRHVVRGLGLENVRVACARAECFSADADFSTITARAFSSLPDFVETTRHLAGAATRFLAMKGKPPKGELASLPSWVRVVSVTALQVPGLDAERNLVIMRLAGKDDE